MTRNHTLAGLAVAGLLFAVVVAAGVLGGGSPTDTPATGQDGPGETALPAGHPEIPAGEATQNGAMIDALQERHAADPDDVDTTLALANAYLLDEQPGKAVPLYRHILSGQPDNEEAQAQLALAWHAQGDQARAQAVLDDLLANHPESQLGHYNLAILCLAQNRPEQAKREWQRAAAIDPDSDLGVSARNFIELMEETETASPGAP